MDVPLYVTTFVWVMNKEKYDDMSPAQKKVIDDHCRPNGRSDSPSPWADFEHAGRDKMRAEAGHEVYSSRPSSSAAWRRRPSRLKAKWAEGAKKAGVDPDKAFADLTATLDKYKAGY